ncbi:unnamed protein product, partial [Polarella glacialis]
AGELTMGMDGDSYASVLFQDEDEVEAFFVTVVGADTPAEMEGLSEADLAKFKAVILIYARRMKRQAGQNDTGPAAVGSPSSSVMTTANFVAPHLVNAADVGYFLLKTCLGVLPFHLQADQPMWNAFKNRNDEAKLQGRTPFLYIELTSLRCATDNTRFSRSVSQWTSTFLRYATVAVGFGHLSWPQIISHVDVIMQPAEAELTKGRPAYAAFVYDDLVRKQFALRAEKKDPNLDIGNQIQTVNKELFEQVRQQLESVLTAAGMNNNSSGSGSQVKQLALAQQHNMSQGAAMLKGQGKGENGKSGKEGKKGQTQNWQQNDGGFQKTKKMLKKEAWFNKNKNLADERKTPIGAGVNPVRQKWWIDYLLAMLDDERLLADDASKKAGRLSTTISLKEIR